jgi:hypothetical protein
MGKIAFSTIAPFQYDTILDHSTTSVLDNQKIGVPQLWLLDSGKRHLH